MCYEFLGRDVTKMYHVPGVTLEHEFAFTPVSSIAQDGRMIRETSGMNKRVFPGCHPRRNTSDYHHHHIHRRFTTVSVDLGMSEVLGRIREDEALAQTEREILLR